MKILITGASGYLGNKLAHTLASNGNTVHALVRSATAEKLLQHPNIKVFKGDLLQKESLIIAMKDCNQVYHAAAKVGAWAKDASIFYKVNFDGTRNVLDAALQLGVEKMVFTSTSGIIGPTLNGPLKEDSIRSTGFEIDYDLSKKLGEDLVIQYAHRGMNVVIVSPSKIYGPGNISHSLMANAIIDTFLKKRIVFIPAPGTYQVCFAYIDDIVNGHLLAMEKGASGERYILGGENISYYNFFDRISTISKCKGHIIQLPKKVIKTWAFVQEMNYMITGSPVRFPVKSVDHVFSNYTFSSEKAIKNLGYKITSLDEALAKTIHFLKSKQHA